MIESQIEIIVCFVFFFAGFIKGVIGLGLPTISLALLTIVTNLPTAMALLLAPSLVTNILQVFTGKEIWQTIRRLWLFLFLCAVCVPVGAKILLLVELSIMSALLGALLILYAIGELIGVKIRITKEHEKWVGGFSGAFTGLFTGMTGSCVVPGVMFLKVIGLGRKQMIQSMGLLFTVSTLALSFALYQNLLLPLENVFLSGLGVIPAILGMYFGTLVREKISRKMFNRIFLLSLFVLGLYLTLEPVI